MAIQAVGQIGLQVKQMQELQSGGAQGVPVSPQLEPLETAEGAKAISEEAFIKHIENLNRLLSAKSTSVSLTYDSLSSPEKVSIVDAETGKLIREMPAQAAVEIAIKARDYIIGLMVDQSI